MPGDVIYRDTQPAWMAASGIMPKREEPGVTGLCRYEADYDSITGGNTNQYFNAPSGKVWIYLGYLNINPDSTVGTNAIIYSEKNNTGGGGVSAGCLRITASKDTTAITTKYGFNIDEYNGSSWTNLGSEAITTRTVGTRYYLTWEIDITGKTTNLYVNGTAWSPGSKSTTNTPVVDGPSFYNDPVTTGKGGGGWTHHRISECWMNDDQGSSVNTRQTYDGTFSTSDNHVLALYPLTDDTIDPAYTQSGSCDGTLYRTIRYPEIVGADLTDYINAAGDGTDNDALFTVDDINRNAPATAPTIIGVQVAAGAPLSGSYALVDNIMLDEGGTLSVPGSPYYNGGWRTAVWPTPPVSASWSESVVNGIKAAVRSNESVGVNGRAYILMVAVVGTNMVRPDTVADCPPVAAAAPPVGMQVIG